MTASDNNLRLAFAVDAGKFPGMDDQELFDVRQFSVHEEMSGLFAVSVVAVVEEPNIPLQAFVGRAAAFRVQTPNNGAVNPVRVWAGICSHMSHLHAADPGMSAYHVSIVPVLWRTSLRKNSRIFQHKSTIEIVTAILAEWQIKATWQLSATYAAHEYCVQYGETDYVFMSRLLEDAGISYYFEFNASSGKGNDIVTLVFDDSPHTARKTNTRGGSLAYIGNQAAAFGSLPDFCTTVSLTQRVAPGKVTMRDFDFRLPPTLNLSAQISVGDDPESVYEQFEYVPGDFSWEPGKDDEGKKALADKYSNGKPARTVADAQKANLTTMALEAERRRQLVVGFHTNAIDLRPGLICAVNQGATTTADHPRIDLTPDDKLLVTATFLEGQHNGEWSMTVSAAYTTMPFRPERRTRKPTIYGVQSAIVVGPKGSEVWSDEFGRVRVQFHWDREGKYDDNSSCWMRVSQAWAGGGFGINAIPRVGHEVLVQFFEGNPDLPVIVGRVHNLFEPTPYELPDNQTVTGIKTNSLPGGGGFNELKFDDKAGHELIHVQAQNTLSTVVKGSETRDVGGSRTTNVQGPEELDIRTTRMTKILTSDQIDVGDSHKVRVGKNGTGSEFKDKSIVLSSGGASIQLEDGNIYITATNGIHIHAGAGIELTTVHESITIQGGPNVVINEGLKVPAPDPMLVVGPALEPAKPGGGPSGTAPNLPSGGSSIDKPGPLSADVDVDVPTNAVELPSA